MCVCLFILCICIKVRMLFFVSVYSLPVITETQQQTHVMLNSARGQAISNKNFPFPHSDYLLTIFFCFFCYYVQLMMTSRDINQPMRLHVCTCNFQRDFNFNNFIFYVIKLMKILICFFFFYFITAWNKICIIFFYFMYMFVFLSCTLG